MGGLLKVAPEHADPEVLRLMKKPSIEDFTAFDEKFRQASAAAGKKQHLVPYFIAGHPGSDLHAMIALARFLKRTGYPARQGAGLHSQPHGHRHLHVLHRHRAHHAAKRSTSPAACRERKLQRALLQFFKPENYFDVREALLDAGREDLIGDGPECLIKARPPRSLEKQKPRRAAPESFSAALPCSPQPTAGYRPYRTGARRREREKG